MKIAFVHPAFMTAGGAEILLASQAQFLRQSDFATRILTFEYDPRFWTEWLEQIEVLSCPPQTLPDRVSDFLLTRNFRLSRWVQRALASDEVAIGYNYPASTVLGLAEIKGRKIWHCCEPPRSLYLFETNPALATRAAEHSDVPVERAVAHFRRAARAWRRRHRLWMLPRRQRLVDRSAVAAIPEIWAISEYTRDSIARVYGRTNVPVIYPMVRFRPGDYRRSGVGRDGLSVLCHTRLELQKNVDTVVRGFSQFAASPKGARSVLHIVGEGPERHNLEALARQLGLSARIRFHGFLAEDKLNEVYQECDVFALLPLDEPFGMVFPEAAARGLLLVGPNHGGPREIMADGEFGLCVDAFCPDCLADALSSICSMSDASVDALREKAARACLDRFGRETIGARLMGLLNEAPG